MDEVKQTYVFARMSLEDVKLVQEVSKARGEGLSSFVRRAIRTELARLSYLTDAEKKALGLRAISTNGDGQ